MGNALTSLRLAKEFTAEVLLLIPKLCWRMIVPAQKKYVPNAGWWQRPGLGVQYQIEYRPGLEWQRDWPEFNRTMSNPDGSIKFNGPFPKIAEWVKLSKEIGIDYHSMEIKWHDGICYFNTKLTNWKTKADYAGQFAELSRRAKIPFMFYYSSLIDHNPQFDSIQPKPRSTESIIALGRQPVYEDYLRGHYREIMEQYGPDGIWLDWYWPDYSTKTSIEFFRKYYPNTVLAFNFANYLPSSYKRLDFAAGEAHDLDGPYIKLLRSGDATLPVWCSAWKWATLYRRLQGHSSEIISPSGRWWSDPAVRDDPLELLRMSAIVMASGLKQSLGVAERMEGGVYPDQLKQLRLLGKWYLPRKRLFTESVPLRYRGREPRSVIVDTPGIRVIACSHEGDYLVHLINMEGSTRPFSVVFRGGTWRDVKSVGLEPSGVEIPVERRVDGFRLRIGSEIDPVDTILRLRR